MSDKFKKIYKSLVSGATNGLEGQALFEHVIERNPKATSKKIVKASLLALSDPDLKDAKVLHAIYALAIKHRIDRIGEQTNDDEDDDRPNAMAAEMVA